MSKEKSERDKLIDELEREPEVDPMSEESYYITRIQLMDTIRDELNIAVPMSFKKTKQDHYTFPEDENPNPMAGYGWINLNVFFEKFPELIEWHEKITKRGSFAQKIGIPNWAVVAAWKAMIEYRLANDTRLRKQGLVKRFWLLSNSFFRLAHKFWYEGPIGKEPKVIQDPPSGEMY